MKLKSYELQEEKNLTNFLQKSILSKDDIDDLFEQLYESDDDEDLLGNELYFKQKDNQNKTKAEEELAKKKMTFSEKMKLLEKRINTEKM